MNDLDKLRFVLMLVIYAYFIKDGLGEIEDFRILTVVAEVERAWALPCTMCPRYKFKH